MPRGRTLLLSILAIVAIIIFAKSSSSSDQQFYDSTLERLQSKQQDAQQQKMGTAAVIDAKLKAAAVKVKAGVEEAAEERRKKQDDGPAEDEHGRHGSHGAKPKQKVMGGGAHEDGEAREGKPHEVGTARGKWTGEEEEVDAAKGRPEQTREQKAVEAELSSVLKRSPIIIFSKTYCPHSKRAKAVFSKYDITPAPFVFEVDQYEHMIDLQDKLQEMTGRRTVPNVLISGKSIGGGDDVAALHDQGDLLATIKSMGGKRIVEAKLVS